MYHIFNSLFGFSILYYIIRLFKPPAFHVLMQMNLNNKFRSFILTSTLEISQFVNELWSHCLFPVVDKSGTSCYHLVTRLMRPTDWQQVVPTSLPRTKLFNKLVTTSSYSNLLRTACISLVGTTCSKSVTVINLVTTLFQTCHNNWEQAVRTHPDIGLTTTLLQLVYRFL